MSMKYRKKPIALEARQVCGDHLTAVAEWCGGNAGEDCITIVTMEGAMTADLGDWIIRGVRGEFYPCKSHIFYATYEVESALVENLERVRVALETAIDFCPRSGRAVRLCREALGVLDELNPVETP